MPEGKSVSVRMLFERFPELWKHYGVQSSGVMVDT
jgi:hypothetical protein